MDFDITDDIENNERRLSIQIHNNGVVFAIWERHGQASITISFDEFRRLQTVVNLIEIYLQTKKNVPNKPKNFVQYLIDTEGMTIEDALEMQRIAEAYKNKLKITIG